MSRQKTLPRKPARHAAGMNAGRDIRVVHGDEVHGDKVAGNKTTFRDISNSPGAIVAGGNVAVLNNTAAIEQAFDGLRQALAQAPESAGKTVATQAVENLEAEARKGEQADEKKVDEWFRVLMMMLPDIGEVAIQTFINPIQGLSTAFQKIAKKAQETA